MSQQTQLRREMGLFSSSNILIGIMVGSGIFYLGSFVLMRAGMSLGLALLIWLCGGAITLLSGLCYAELGASMPKAGGGYVYMRESYGNGVAFVSSVSTFILGSCGSTAAIAIAFSENLSSLIGMSDIQIKLMAVFAVVVLTIINIIGVKQGSLVQNIFTVGKLIPIIIILGAGLFLGTQSPDLSITPATAEPVSIAAILSMIAFGTVATLWAYEGWTSLNVISEEIKNPKRNIPRAIILSIAFVTVLYTCFNYAIYKILPYNSIVESIENGNIHLGTEAARFLFGSAGGTLVGICMVVAVFGALNGCVLVFPRTCFAIARDGMFPRVCAKIHPKYRTPHIALIVHMVISIALIFTRNLNQITALVTFTGMFCSVLTFGAVLTLRKKFPTLERPYRVNTGIIYITILIMLALAVNSFISDMETSLISISVPVISFIVYLFIKKNITSPTEVSSIEE